MIKDLRCSYLEHTKIQFGSNITERMELGLPIGGCLPSNSFIFGLKGHIGSPKAIIESFYLSIYLSL